MAALPNMWRTEGRMEGPGSPRAELRVVRAENSHPPKAVEGEWKVAFMLLLAHALASAVAGFSDAANYFHYHMASASYCSSASLNAWNCAPCARADASIDSLRVFSNSSTGGRAFTALVTPRGGDAYIALSFRGTEGLENWINNLKFLKTDRTMSCKDCKVHSGFVDVWSSLAGHVVPELKQLRSAHPSAPLVVVGHSLGGAIATLSSYVLAVDLGIPVEAVYTYGSPRVGNKEFAAAETRSSSSWRVTHHRDIVPHLPPETLLGFHHTATEVFYNDGGLKGKECDGSGEDDSCSRQYVAPFWSVHDHLHYFNETTGEDGC